MSASHFFNPQKPLSLTEIARRWDCELVNPLAENEMVVDVAALVDLRAANVAYYGNTKYKQDLIGAKAGVIIISPQFKDLVNHKLSALVTSKPYRIFAAIASHFYPKQASQHSIHPSAIIAPSAIIGINCRIDAYVVIGEGATIGDNTIIGSHCVVGENCSIGANSLLEPHVVISHTIAGNNLFVKRNTSIGQPGFGFHMDEAGHFDVPQVGCVIIGNDVQIGANCCIDRGSQHNTIIGSMVRIDNLVQIAHNVEIGEASVMVAQSGIAGSSQLGKFVVVAGQVGIAGHIAIGDGAQIAAQSGLMRNVEAKGKVAGTPAVPIRQWHKQTLALAKLANNGV